MSAADASLAHLLDRAAISDLLNDFARRLDAKDWQGYADNFTDDGVLELPWKTQGRHGLAEHVAADLAGFHATQHYSSNHVVEIDGDTARSRSYLLAVHVLEGGDLARHADAGGRYDCELRRTADGWRFVRVRLEILWTGGEPLDL